MSYRPTRQDRENEKPGYCVTCGKWAEYRNTGGQCMDCHNASYQAYRLARKADNAQAKERGREYWAKQGIKPGDKVKRFCVSWFGLGGIDVIGIAKAGACGAYVISDYQQGKFAPDGWQKV